MLLPTGGPRVLTFPLTDRAIGPIVKGSAIHPNQGPKMFRVALALLVSLFWFTAAAVFALSTFAALGSVSPLGPVLALCFAVIALCSLVLCFAAPSSFIEKGR